MEQYINKATLEVEIRKRLLPVIRDKHYNEWEEGQDSERIAILDIINTLEVKEVDEVKIGETQIYLEDDGGEQPYDSKQWLDLSCTEYEIPKTLFKDGDNVEIFIRKAQKGKRYESICL